MLTQNRALFISAAIALVVLTALYVRPYRPDQVPAEATHVPWGSSGIWVHCTVDRSQLVHCHIYNASGIELKRPMLDDSTDDVFLRFEGTAPLRNEDLQIDPLNTGPIVVWLKNGVILLPRDQYAGQKKALEETLAVRAKQDRR